MMLKLLGMMLWAALLIIQPDSAGWSSKLAVEMPADELSPVWSPDGTQIAFVGHQTGDPEIYILDIASGEVRDLSNDLHDDYTPLWSPDGAYLAFSHRGRAYSAQPFAVSVVDVATGKVQAAAGDGVVRRIDWAGDRLLITQMNQVLRFDPRTGAQDSLFSVSAEQQIYSVTPSANGAWLALVVYTSPTVTFDLFLLNTGTGVVTDTHIDSPQNIAWSPDSRYLAYTQGEFYRPITLNLLDIERQTLHTVDEVAETWLADLVWSPDSRLAWADYDSAKGLTTVRLLQSVGQPPRSLFSINHPIEWLAWSPTRNHLAFHTYAGVYVADVESGIYSELVQEIGRVWRTEWSADGNYLAARFVAVRDNKWGGAVVITDIRDSTQRYTYSGSVSSEFRWSPIDARLAFSAAESPGEANIVILSHAPSA